MKFDNNDPIQEIKPFRWGLDNDELNPSDSDDLHDCSTDLSDEGSRKEEREHAEFAKRKRQELLNNINNWTNAKRTKKANITKNFSIAAFIIFIIFMNVMSSIMQLITKLSTYNYEEQVYNTLEHATSNVLTEEMKALIEIREVVLQDGQMAFAVLNRNTTTVNDVEVQVLFYDETDSLILKYNTVMHNLFSEEVQFVKMYGKPKEYARLEFVIKEANIHNLKSIDLEELQLDVSQIGDNEVQIEVTNNTEKTLDTVVIAAIYLKDNEIIELDMKSMFVAGQKIKTDEMTLTIDEEYDDVQFIINDVIVY